MCSRCRPKGGPGIAEWGMLTIPKKLVQAAWRHGAQASDGRMSGRAMALILHGRRELRRRQWRVRRRRARGACRRGASTCTSRRRNSTPVPRGVENSLRHATFAAMGPCLAISGGPKAAMSMSRRQGADSRTEIHDRRSPASGGLRTIGLSTTSNTGSVRSQLSTSASTSPTGCRRGRHLCLHWRSHHATRRQTGCGARGLSRRRERRTKRMAAQALVISCHFIRRLR